MKKKYLITGVTGFVGSYVCVSLLKKPSTSKIYLIARSRGRLSVEQRIDKLIAPFFKDDLWKSKIVILEGDITENQFGLSSKNYEEIKENVNIVFHCAASISFSLSYEEAKKINYQSTMNVIELMNNIEPAKFERLNYISTAYIAGSITDGFSEKDLSRNQLFSNTYEQTKYECECKLQELMEEGKPISIFRPSIIGSDSKTGYIHPNSIIFIFIRFFSKGKIQKFICKEQDAINVVPIDYFVDGMLSLSEDINSLGKTYHLVNSKNVNITEVIQVLCTCLNSEPPKLESEDLLQIEKNPLYHFFQYVNSSHRFDDTFTTSYLSPKGITCSSIDDDYIKLNIEYCKANGLI